MGTGAMPDTERGSGVVARQHHSATVLIKGRAPTGNASSVGELGGGRDAVARDGVVQRVPEPLNA